MEKNSYILRAHTQLNDIDKLVRDIARIFFVQPAGSEQTANLIIELSQTDSSFSLQLAKLTSNKLLPVHQELITLANLDKSRWRHKLKLQLFKALATIYQERQDEWGILSGVRPIKLVQMLMAKGLYGEELREHLETEYLLSPAKIELAIQIANCENAILSKYQSKNNIAVYVGVPYCNSKCTYCSFPSGLLPENALDTELFLQTIEQDVKDVIQLANECGLNISSLYIGGGTPTSFSDTHFADFINILRPLTNSLGLQEFTFEAGRVDSLTEHKLELLQDIGITRISLNPQTFNDATLQKVGRNHTVQEFECWYEYVRTNFEWQINMDIILGLPSETLVEVEYTLNKVAQLAPDSLTVHVLAFKKDSTLFSEYQAYYQDNAVVAQMLNMAKQTAAKMQLVPYYLYRQGYILGNLENIGYAKLDCSSLYNIMIMREQHTIIGIGPSSKTKLVAADNKIETFFMPKNVHTYIEKQTDSFAKRKKMLLQSLEK